MKNNFFVSFNFKENTNKKEIKRQRTKNKTTKTNKNKLLLTHNSEGNEHPQKYLWRNLYHCNHQAGSGTKKFDEEVQFEVFMSVTVSQRIMKKSVLNHVPGALFIQWICSIW